MDEQVDLSDIERAQSVLQPFMAVHVSEYRDKVGDSPEESEAFGDMCFGEEDYVGALAHMKKAVEQGGATVSIFMKLGAASESCNEDEPALEAYKKAFELGGGFESAIASGQMARALGLRQEAESWFKQAAALAPNKAYPHSLLASFYREEGRRAQAAEEAKIAAELTEDSWDDWIDAAELAIDAGLPENGEAFARKALELKPTDRWGMVLVSAAQWQAGNTQAAVRSARLATELGDNPEVIHGLLAWMFEILGHAEESEQELKKQGTLDRYDQESLKRLIDRFVQ